MRFIVHCNFPISISTRLKKTDDQVLFVQSETIESSPGAEKCVTKRGYSSDLDQATPPLRSIALGMPGNIQNTITISVQSRASPIATWVGLNTMVYKGFISSSAIGKSDQLLR